MNRAPSFLHQLGQELKKLFARKRTYLGFGSFLFVEILILVLLNLPRPRESFRRLIEQNGYAFETYFGGLTLGMQMVLWTVLLLGALYLALVGGDVVAKEVEEGTMRMTLCRPISRWRLGLLKYMACIIYTVALIFFIGASAIAAGVIYKGVGALFVYVPLERLFALYDTGPGLARIGLALLLLAASCCTFTSLAFLFSCGNMRPAAATILTLSLIFFDSIFRNIPYFESIEAWFMATHISAWVRAFSDPIPWWRMLEDYAYLLALDATAVLFGLALFSRRDFKS